MAILAVAPGQIDGSSNAGYLYDSETATVLYVGLLKPSDNRPIYATLIRNSDGARFTAPDEGGNMIVNVMSEGLLVDKSNGAALNFGFESGTL